MLWQSFEATLFYTSSSVSYFHVTVIQPYCQTYSRYTNDRVIILDNPALFSISVYLFNYDKKTRYSYAVGICLALLLHTREETALTLVIFLQIAFYLLITNALLYKKNVKALLSNTLVMLYPIILPIILLTVAIYSLNFLQDGHFAKRGLLIKEEQQLIKSLISIKPSKSYRYIPITTEARLMAYKASPTLAQFQHSLEDQESFKFTSSANYTGVPGEMDIMRHIVTYSHEVAQNKPDIARRKILTQINNELENAFTNGTLPKRFALTYAIDPDYNNWLYHIPKSFKFVTGHFVSKYVPWKDNYSTHISKRVTETYDKVANRRANLLKKGPLTGCISIANKALTKIDIFRLSYYDYRETIQFIPTEEQIDSIDIFTKKKIPNSPIFTGENGNYYCFESSIFNDRLALFRLKFDLHTNDGKVISVNNLAYNVHKGEHPQYIYFIDSFELRLNFIQKLGYKIQTMLSNIYPHIIILLTYLAIMLFIGNIILNSFVIKKKLSDYNWKLIIIFTNIFLIIGVRIMYFTLVDASLWIASSRYLIPVIILYYSLLIPVISLLIVNVIKSLKS
jgi:hypothetical protein